jgi:riboflavin-specific deaminase-like protein
VRLVKGRNPLRVVADSRLRIPLNSKILKDLEIAPTTIVTTPQADREKASSLKRMGIDVLTTGENSEGMVDLKDLLQKLGKKNISSVLVEGGATTITSFIRQGLADKVIAIVAPKIMGRGVEAVGDLGILKVDRALKLSFDKVYRKGDDVIIESSIA